MKKIILLFSFIFCQFLTIHAQSKANFEIIKKIHEKSTGSIDVFVKGDIARMKELIEGNGGLFKRSAGDIAIVNLTFQQIALFLKSPGIIRVEAYPQQTVLMNDTMLVNNRVIGVHNGDAPLTQAYDGTGVVIGVMDTGIDFTHPDFLDSLGKTRVKFLWDQTLPFSIFTPVEYKYGQAWDKVQIDSGLAVLTTDGHGTHVAGIAASNGKAVNNYKGVAPKADLVIVKVDLNSTSSTIVADAVDFIYTKAQLLGEPCVINASIGNYFGSHDGKDLQAQFINNLIDLKNGRAFVASAGNKGDSRIHLGYTVTADTNFTYFSKSGSIYMEIWGDTATFKNIKFAVGVDQWSPVYSKRAQTPFKSIKENLGIYKADTLLKNGKRIGIVECYGDLIGATYCMAYYILPDSASYKWKLQATGSGKFDLWSFDMISSNLPSSKVMKDSVFHKSPDLNQTIVSSYQCLDNVITVGNYVNRRSYVDYNHQLYYAKETVGKRHSSSSCGPTRDGRLKPDISSPGDMTIASLVQSLRPIYIAGQPSAITPEGFHVRDGGTSSAGPGVAGIAALYLQQNPTATAIEVKNAIIGCARQDNFTGSIANNEYGYGKADAFKTLTKCAPDGIATFKEDALSFRIFPNPANAGSIIHFDIALPRGSVQTLLIYNELGACVSKIAVPKTDVELAQTLAPGVYFCKLISSTKVVATKKLVIL
jgi:subtilisin family serine protease